MTVSFVGLDLAKTVFQVHAVDDRGKPALAKRLHRHALLRFFANVPRCIVGIEACATAHYWAREITRLGHVVRLLPPKYVKPYVKRHKNDQIDAEAICEAMQRPTMRFVPIKTEQQQGMLVVHRVRETLVHQKTQLINGLRAHLAEFGIVAPQGAKNVSQLKAHLADPGQSAIPGAARPALQTLADQLSDTEKRIAEIDAQLEERARRDEVCQRLMTMPGIGPVNATALVATIGDASAFKSGRHLAAWLGLVPRQTSSGCKERLGHISKAGDGYLRRMLVNGARVVVRWRRTTWPWLAQLLHRRPAGVGIVALANKLARIVWAIITRRETFRSSPRDCANSSPVPDRSAVLASGKAKPLARRPVGPALPAPARGAAK
jgi:transposase